MAESTASPRSHVDADRSIQSEDIVQFLLDPTSHSDPPDTVELIETHISWVFLTTRFAYKLKKPVCFDFLDFSTIELRKKACEVELQLNRRLARDVYMHVLPITKETHGRLKIHGNGRPVDWVVQMRRLPADRSMDVVIGRSELTDAEVQRVSDLLNDFYTSQPPVSIKTSDYRTEIESHVQGNRASLLAIDPSWASVSRDDRHTMVKRIHAAQLQMLRLHPDVFDSRVIDGRIVEGHGDLRPDHIYLTTPPKIIDCIEFNRSFRVLDVLDELSFLAVECAYHDAPDVGGRILQRYCQATNDIPPKKLLTFYMSYRATVRAKVFALRSEQIVGDERDTLQRAAYRYLKLADQYALELAPPLLIVVRGLSGTGKSTVAEAVANDLGIEVLSTDAIRRERFDSRGVDAGIDQGIYSAENRAAIYDEMLRRAGRLLSTGMSVVLDGTFLNARTRQHALHVARHTGASIAMIECRCADDVAVERIRSRIHRGQCESDATPELFAPQKEVEELDSCQLNSLQLDTTENMALTLSRIFGYLRASGA